MCLHALAILHKNRLWVNICFVHKAVSLRCKNTGYFNGVPYYISGNKILELSWPFCWYWKEITKRLLRLKSHLKHYICIVSGMRSAQVIIDNDKRTCKQIVVV